MTTTATTPTLAPGTVITARPWIHGTECEPQTAIVLGNSDDLYSTDDYVLVWFPTLGAPQVGHAVQGTLTAKATDARTLADMPRAFIRNAYRAAMIANHDGRWIWFGAGAALEREARARRARR